MARPLVLALALSLALAIPAAAADDVAGWRTLRWGMTEAETRQALEAAGLAVEPEAGRSRGAYVPFGARVDVGGQPYRASFQFADDTRGLVEVALRTRTYPTPAGTAHQALLDRLRTEHGAPHTAAARPRPTATWTFPTTSITLYGPVASGDMSSIYDVALIYRAATGPGRSSP